MGVTENELAEVVVGACGWEHAPWLETYYPDDLPAEWQLDYYANEFGCVVLPPEKWLAADEETIQAWVDEVAEDFLFFLELPARAADLNASVNAFAGRCAGVIMPSRQSDDWSAVPGNIPLLCSEDTGQLRRYHPVGQAETVLAWLAAGPGERIELPILREQIETALKGVAATSRLAFIIGKETPAMENLQNAKVLAELLGA
jgi:hypothetical protein